MLTVTGLRSSMRFIRVCRDAVWEWGAGREAFRPQRCELAAGKPGAQCPLVREIYSVGQKG